MTSWPKVLLGNVIEQIVGGKNIEAGNGTSPYRILKVSAVTSGVFRPGEAKPAPNGYVPAPEHHIREADFLFSRANTSELVGAVAIANNPPSGLLLPDKVWRIEWNGKRIESRYAYYLLRSAEARRVLALIGSGTSGSMKNISQTKLNRLVISLPPLDEQQRIVGLLDRAAEIRHRAEAARAKARAIIPALFLNTFGDPVTNHKGWPIGILGDHADVQGGVQVSAKRATLPVELPYLRVANVMRGSLSLSEIKTICVTSAEAKRTSLVQGDILIVEGHGNPNEIGRAAIWDGSIPGCIHQNHLIRVRPYQTHLRSEYVETFLNSDVGRRILIQDGKTTSGLNTISTRNVKNVAVLIAPIDLQSAFTVQVRRVGEVARLLDTAAVKAEAMAAALSAEVFGSPLHGPNAGQDAYGH